MYITLGHSCIMIWVMWQYGHIAHTSQVDVAKHNLYIQCALANYHIYLWSKPWTYEINSLAISCNQVKAICWEKSVAPRIWICARQNKLFQCFPFDLGCHKLTCHRNSVSWKIKPIEFDKNLCAEFGTNTHKGLKSRKVNKKLPKWKY